jgi:hypothetical protein
MNETNQLFHSSPELNEIFSAFSKFTGEVPNLLKSDTVKVQTKSGSSYNFRYVTLDDAIDTVKPYLTKNGLAISQLETGKSVITLLTHSSGQWYGTETFFGSALREGMNSQDIGGVTTYVKRRSYISILGLSADEDDDSNSANGNTVTSGAAPKPAPKVTAPAPKPAPAPAPRASAPEPQEDPAPWEQDDTPAVTPEVNAGPASDDIPGLIAHAKTFTSRPELQKWFQGVFAAASDKKTLSKELGSVVQGLMKTLA